MSVYVGIDVHRKRSQVAVIAEDGKVQLNRNVVNGSEPMLRLIGGLPAGTPVAAVGQPKGPLPAKPQTLPKLDVTAKGEAKGAVRASIANTSGIPQYELEIYAWARKGGRYVAAGRADLPFLNSGDTTQVRVPLVGDPKGARIHVTAPPTIFQ